MTTAAFHPVAEIFPMMSDREFQDLVTDIREHGVRESVWLHRDGRIIDGRNRWRACAQLGDEPPTRVYEGDDADLIEFVLSLNLHRRHLNESQRAMVADRIANMQQGARTDLAQIQAMSQTGAAKLLNVGRSTVQAARKVREAGVPAMASLVDAGEVAVSAAAQVAEVVRERAAEVPPEQVKEIVREAIVERREQVAKQREDRQALDDLAKELNLPKIDEKAEDKRIAVTHEFFRAVHALASLPSPAELVPLIPDYQRYRMSELPAALAWLSEFVDVWKARQ